MQIIMLIMYVDGLVKQDAQSRSISVSYAGIQGFGSHLDACFAMVVWNSTFESHSATQ